MLTTAEVEDTLLEYGQAQHRILNAAPLALPPQELPVDPYVFGAWLGDGHRRDGTISKPDEGLWEAIESRGYALGGLWPSSKDGRSTRTVHRLRGELRRAGLLGHKHVPAAYFRGSVEQRIALLRGLMDTDGGWNVPRKQAQFSTTDKGLAVAVAELVASLGGRTKVHEFETEGFGLRITAYSVAFTPTWFNPFLSKTKADRVVFGAGVRATQRVIQRVEEVPTVPTQCITVDSPDSTYLAGEQMVPTHNSGKVGGSGPMQPTQYAWMIDHSPLSAVFGGVPVEKGLLVYLRAQEDHKREQWLDLTPLKPMVPGWLMNRARLAELGVYEPNERAWHDSCAWRFDCPYYQALQVAKGVVE